MGRIERLRYVEPFSMLPGGPKVGGDYWVVETTGHVIALCILDSFVLRKGQKPPADCAPGRRFNAIGRVDYFSDDEEPDSYTLEIDHIECF